ncbi:MAG: lipoprotein-releasing ABC transporter permease subunit [Methylotetracoccus sp.]|nr:lipoprotein-releasing ABC transporter permease subunit [Methylotetracoccus sp.]
MFRPLIVFIGLRYTRARRRTRFISFITFTSILGIALGVTALITVLSVMNGFEAELRDRILGMTSHATVSGPEGQLNEWPVVEPTLREEPRILGWAPYIEGQAMVNFDRRVSGVMLRGIRTDYESNVSEVTKRLVQGHLDDLKPGQFGIILGSELASYLGVAVGDKLTVITPQVTATPAGILPRLKRFTVVGMFQVGMYEYDRNLALIELQDAGRLFQMGDAVTGVRLRLDDVFYAHQVARDLGPKLSGDYFITDWTQAHSNFFRAIQTEKRVMFIILLLIVAVAAFNIVSTLVMVVTDKRADIAILRTQGMTPMDVMGIFIVLGTVIGAVGTVIGGIGGVLLATLYPAWQASRIRPAEELRYE